MQNVETLAHLALIARYGAAWFRAVGTAAEPGTHAVHHPAGGRQLGRRGSRPRHPAAGLLGFSGQVQAVLAGGYHGAWLPAGQAGRLALSNAALRPAGASAGAGVLAALPAGTCGLAEMARVARYLALESAGQCGPCLNGLPRIATALAGLAGIRPAGCVIADLSGGRDWPRAAARATTRMAPSGSSAAACGVFAAEIRSHQQRPCTAAGGRAFLPVPAGPRQRE